MRDPVLADRLAAFAIDEGAPSLSFAARLARENRWPLPRARRVVGEYLRFVYLAAVSSETVTPSVEVDQAWHLHLCYTRSYWHRLCREILGRELHHGPTRGGAAENRRFHECYERTLRLYQEEFGEAPPSDIWPPAARRFAAGASPVSVSPAEHLILPKAKLRRAALLSAIVPAAALGLGALARTDAIVPLLFFILFLALLISALVRLLRARGGSSRDNRRSDGGCSSSAGCGSGSGGHDFADSSSDGGGDSSGCGGGCGGGGCGGGGCGGGGD